MTLKHLLISTDYIKQATAIDLNIDSSLLKDSILWSQLNYIKNIVGSGLMNEIVLQHSGNTLTADNTTLLNDYIAPALAWYSLYESSDFVAVRFKNIGIGKLKSDDFQPLSEKELNSVKNKIKNRAEGWGQEIIKFINSNLDKYPLYSNPGNSFDTVYPTPNAYSTSIFLYKQRYSSKNPNYNYNVRDCDNDTNNRITLS